MSEVYDFIRQNSFGILINQVDGKPWATHIPLELEKRNGKDVLVGHIAKANPHWKSFQKEAQMLCIFNGPHAYVSSSWYKEEEVPTWNYIAVHVYGSLKILSEEETIQSLHRLVDHYESQSKNPLSLHDVSPKTLRQVKGVVGFSITVEEIQAAYKLSQTRQDDHAAIISNLEERGVTESEIARHMKKQSNNH